MHATASPRTAASAAAPEPPQARAVFELHLANFAGPFDLLLSLISKRELDITEVALAEVTDEFIAHIRRVQASEGEWSLDEASEFLVVAATLLDLKTARLLPSGAVEDDEDIALLEARDLLFARLLQYRAFKAMARHLGGRLAEEGNRYPRTTPLEAKFAAMLPELMWQSTPEEFAALAVKVLAPREPAPSEVGLAHLHHPLVSIREQGALIEALLRNVPSLSFGQLIADAGHRAVVVARFLALLDMFRDAVISFEQAAPLGELRLRWSAEPARWSPEEFLEDDAAALSAKAPAAGCVDAARNARSDPGGARIRDGKDAHGGDA
ncbi:ScpA family protein [Arthrobacter sp. Br18]|uniref:segregation and condensation protein A n=1 Tax=Arthrobacter sp. Br18 TaxID=1312954 RepID=UPI0009DD7579|nr:ScpA family protein [Arthrobacter sp. Br18]